ncbi:MAG: hypothetical protein EOP00_24870 [Pedobacter sp.]|nr:MAG: hypothetical protein EOP00_24870 [Pedobacter sp.]
MKKYPLFFATPLALLFAICLSCNPAKTNNTPLKVGISPYQDLAMIVNIKNLKLEEKYSTNVDLQTMNWENILPALASQGNTIDIGFGSLIEFLTKENNINRGVEDPLVFIYPAYIFKGGGFITFNKTLPEINNSNINNSGFITNFFKNKIGAQKNSIYEMMLYSLARRGNFDISSIQIFNTSLNDGILATKSGSLDIAAAGLTQISEAEKQNGKTILTMESLGFADVTGFVCKQSILESRRKDVENVIKMWYDCVNYVMLDLDKNSKFSLQYLDEKAATKYTLEQYKSALSQEYFPISLSETKENIINKYSKFSYLRISSDVAAYLINNKIVTAKPLIPSFINIK